MRRRVPRSLSFSWVSLAQSQRFTPEATGRHTSDRLNVQVNLSEKERISDLSLMKSHIPIQGTNNTPLQGNKDMPRQGKNKRPNVSCVKGHNASSSEGEEKE